MEPYLYYWLALSWVLLLLLIFPISHLAIKGRLKFRYGFPLFLLAFCVHGYVTGHHTKTAGGFANMTYKRSADGSLQPYPNGAFCRSTDSSCFTGPDLNRSVVIKSELNAITENPKVRTIHPTMTFRITDINKFASRVHDWTELSDNCPASVLNAGNRLSEIQKINVQELHSCVYGYVMQLGAITTFDLLDSHSRELSKLSNPMDQAQQERFRGIVGPYMRRHLAQYGISTEDLKFEL